MANFNDIVRELDLPTTLCGPLALVRNDPKNIHSFTWRGAIYEPSSGRLVAPPISVPHTVYINPDDLDKYIAGLPEIASVNWQRDGITYRMYQYAGEWRISTNGLIEPATRGWGNGPNFLKIFQEATASAPIDTSSLDPAYCYCYFVQHPAHYEVFPPAEASCKLYALLPVGDELAAPKFMEGELSPSSVKDILTTVLQDQVPVGALGCRIQLSNGAVLRFNTRRASQALHLRGNTSNALWRMCELASRHEHVETWLEQVVALTKEYDGLPGLQERIMTEGMMFASYYIAAFPMHRAEYDSMLAAVSNLVENIIDGLNGKLIKSRHVKIMQTMRGLAAKWTRDSVLAYVFTLEPRHMYYLLDFKAMDVSSVDELTANLDSVHVG